MKQQSGQIGPKLRIKDEYRGRNRQKAPRTAPGGLQYQQKHRYAQDSLCRGQNGTDPVCPAQPCGQNVKTANQNAQEQRDIRHIAFSFLRINQKQERQHNGPMRHGLDHSGHRPDAAGIHMEQRSKRGNSRCGPFDDLFCPIAKHLFFSFFHNKRLSAVKQVLDPVSPAGERGNGTTPNTGSYSKTPISR